jgi:hypothetical protein
MRTVLFVSVLAVTQCANIPVVAQSKCPFDASQLTGGQAYYLDNTTPTALKSTPLIEGPQRKSIDLYYVVKSVGGERNGVVVVKSARLGPVLDGDDPVSDRVALKRDEASRKCDPKKAPGFTGSVSTRAYSEYHDYAQETGEYLKKTEDLGVSSREVLRRFHTSYQTISSCRDTDALRRQDGRYEARSNRSQFSFDIGTVDNGYDAAVYYVVADAADRARSFIFPNAFAAEPKLRERKVEIKHYQTTSGYACIPFRLSVRGTTQVVRVTDLEAPRLWDVTEFRIGPTTGSQP